MDAQSLLQSIDIWCQWDSTFGEYKNFGEHASQLRQYFTAHPDTLQAILLQMLTSRGKQPTKKWLHNWTELKTIVPAALLRHLLVGLAMKREWYKGRANEAEARVLIAYERGQSSMPPNASYEYGTINIYGAYAYSSDYAKLWYKEGYTWYERFPQREAQQTFKIAHGACWALLDFPDSQVRDLLTYLIRVKHQQSGIWTMGQWGDEDAAARLLQIQQRTTHKEVLACIEKILPEIANRRGITMEELKDHAIFTCGLNIQGERTWHVDGFTLRLTVSPGGRMRRTIKGPDGKVPRQRPPRIEDTWQLLTEEAKELSRTLSIQKKHLAVAMKERWDWSWDLWQYTIGAHLIPRYLVCHLVWNISLPDGTHYAYALFDKQGGWHNVEGETILINGEYRLSIAHPVEMTPEEHSRWQRYIVTHKITQPFKQMFRETYVLTPAEEETRTYSNRFSTHVIPRQAMNAPGHRGWQCSGDAIWYDFQRHNIRAYIWTESNYRDAQTILRQIAFYPISHGTLWSQPRLDLDSACLPLRDIPPVVFSEAMRDIAQCLVSASLGTNQQWAREGNPSPNPYRLGTNQQWTREGNPSPSQSNYQEQVQQRELLLCQLLPLLDLGPTVRVEGRLAYIDGTRCRYRVDLGNGTIYTEPGGRYLCIVPRYDMQKLYLPFEESDPKTAEILSKILLLAHDETITDATILRQLSAPRLS